LIHCKIIQLGLLKNRSSQVYFLISMRYLLLQYLDDFIWEQLIRFWDGLPKSEFYPSLRFDRPTEDISQQYS